ncbi:twisted gastrulation protein homolog 1-A-like [Sitophilus oryzae]|uniref:Twisted gastrulation protein homolog 1-A-like n=1 Tax=Sitophilus oryzae TaxID=7048 RepID=A0A6J2Y2X1_SITOR|nr:twisted gastrulation protein homolog 1-A-like [Sitophilus oryzae]
MNYHTIIPLLLLTVYFIQSVILCNEAVCGSVVSKCLLTESCNCDFNFDNCSCCKDCLNCLGYLYTECCSCVDMCPKPNATSSPLSKKSHVEDFQESLPGLFNALTEAPDNFKRWNSTTFPIDIDITHYNNKKEIKFMIQQKNAEQSVLPSSIIYTVNCTVAFWAQCISWTKCKSSCQSMEAESFKWFHDGCCECVGDKCINYGINESRCSNCPVSDELIVLKDNEIDDEPDFGENDDDTD